MSLFRIRVDLVFILEDFDRNSDEIDVLGIIVMCIPDFTPDFNVRVLMVLLILIIRRRGILDSILLKDVLLFIHSGIRLLS